MCCTMSDGKLSIVVITIAISIYTFKALLYETDAILDRRENMLLSILALPISQHWSDYIRRLLVLRGGRANVVRI